MKLTPRFTLVFVLYAAALLAAISLLSFNRARDALRSAAVSELQSMAIEKEAAFTAWIDDYQSGISLLTADPAMIADAAALVTAPPGSPSASAAHDRLVAELQPHITGGEFLELIFLDPQSGQIIASTNPEEEGKLKENRQYFLQGKITPFIQNPYFSIEFQGTAMTAAAPVHSPDDHLLGVLAGRMDLDQLNAIISRRTGLRQSDDVYLVNTSNLFVTQPRFIADPAVLQRGVHTEPVLRCLQRQSGVIESVDYRNIPDIAVYHWLSERELCLVAKLDQSEAYAPVRTLGLNIAFLGVLALLAASALAVALARGLTRPILALKAGADRFGRGELQVRLPETSRDELGDLAHQFNQMAVSLTEKDAQLRQYSLELENRVAERTADLELSLERYSRLFQHILYGFALHEIICDEACHPYDYRFLEVNPAFEKLTGLQACDIIGKTVLEVLPQTEAAWIETYGKVALTGEPANFSSYSQELQRYYEVTAYQPKYGQFAVMFMDVTNRKRAEDALALQSAELARSNKDLEQFAYVASHDLQEPLRMVASYLELIEQRYKNQLDERADKYITFAVDGANRMKILIDDLLAYSRLSTRGREFKPLDFSLALAQAQQNLAIAIRESGARITASALPTLPADDTQIVQLFQNLLGNAIKFCRADPPEICIFAEPRNHEWLFSVRDNGIGIDPQFNDRIFVIFQRLHSKAKYPGTGIGLAVCKKIVERHGGRIWYESQLGAGATFSFTIRTIQEIYNNHGTESRDKTN